jgi:hypothetical protein
MVRNKWFPVEFQRAFPLVFATYIGVPVNRNKILRKLMMLDTKVEGNNNYDLNFSLIGIHNSTHDREMNMHVSYSNPFSSFR